MDKKIPIVDDKSIASLVASQDKIVKMHTYKKSSNRKYQGVLYRYYREPTYFFVNFVLREGRMPSISEADGREMMDEEEVLTSVVIGPNAKKPLQLDIPLFVSDNPH